MLARLVPHARSTKGGCTKVFASTYPNLVEAASASFAGPAIAQMIVGEDRKAVMDLKIPGCIATHLARKPHSGERVFSCRLHLDIGALGLGAVAPHVCTALASAVRGRLQGDVERSEARRIAQHQHLGAQLGRKSTTLADTRPASMHVTCLCRYASSFCTNERAHFSKGSGHSKVRFHQGCCTSWPLSE